MKKLSANATLLKSEMKKIVGGGDGWLYPAMCTRCIEDVEADWCHPPYYTPEGCVQWHCPTEEPVPVPVGP